MQNYFEHLNSLYTKKTFLRKKEYIKFNFGKYINKLTPQSHVLEIGPGVGEFISVLNDNGLKNIDVIDGDKHVLRHISNKYKVKSTSQSLLGNKFELDVQDRYDIIFMMQVFEHIPKDSYVKIISELFSHLDKNGSLILTVPNSGNPLNIVERYADIQHEAMFSEISLKELPEYCNLKNYSLVITPYLIPPYNIINLLRIAFQSLLHFVIKCLLIINGGIYQNILTPQITLIITRNK